MSFNSLHFVFFFPVVVALYFATPYRFRWGLLLGASYYFYMCWKPEYVILIMISTLIVYYAGIQMGKTDSKAKRRNYLILSLASNLAILFFFKYFNFFNNSIRSLFEYYNISYGVPTLNILLPVGISFYTFQVLSYSIDVYRGAKEPEKHLGIFALYVAFFPQLVAGPIERSTRLLPQFFKKYDFDYHRVTDGLKRMLWGFFQKLVIADRLAIYVDAVYSNQVHHGGITLLIATLFFTFQVYCDFAGYSNIAIGAAKVMGFELMENFRRPLFSKSIPELWRRWHISLVSWFRDYLYIPLGGNRVGKWRWYCNIMIVFLITGIWHGANWTYMVWGMLHGFYMIFSLWSKNIREKISTFLLLNRFPAFHKCTKILITFVLFSFSLIIFRANSIVDAFDIFKKIITLEGALFIGQPSNFIFSVFAICFLLIVELKQEFFSGGFSFYRNANVVIRQLSYASLILLILLIGVFGGEQFIYFQF